MDWENWDLRIVACILAILSLSGGIFLGSMSLLIVTIILAVICFAVLLFTPSGPPGTSGDLGMAVLIIGGYVVLILPAWIGYGIKSIVG